jgi:hypothetical protein
MAHRVSTEPRPIWRAANGELQMAPTTTNIVPMIQEQPPETPAPSRIAESLNPPLDLEYPRAAIRVKKENFVMPLILWILVLIFGILIFLTHLPVNAPRIDQLTMYTCDRLPPLPSLGNRQSYPLNLRCRIGDQVIYQRTNTIPYSYQATTIPCIKEIGPTKIWRVAPPSPYGSYIFQVVCDRRIVTDYKSRAAIYKTTQLFVTTMASLLSLAGAMGLIISLFGFRQRERGSNS